MGIRAPGGRAGPDSIYLDENIRTRAISMAEGQIRQAQECAASNAEVEILVGDAPAVVRDFVQEWNAHLLVISRGVASGPLGGLRSHSYSFVRESPCPVVSV